MSRQRICISAVVVALSLVALAGASHAAKTNVVIPNRADVTVDKNEQKRTIDCAGGSVTVSGNGNALVLKGDCSTLKISGNENTVTVEGVAEIATWGNGNKVTWTRGAGGHPPKISNPGTGNSIKRAPK